MLDSVLVVDDDPDIRDVLGIIVQQEGYEVLSAADGAEALRMLQRMNVCPRLIFLDLRMPIMNGWQFREEQLRDSRLEGIPVVVITADSSEVARKGLVGAAGFLAKPLQLQEIRDALARFAAVA
jgi:CheY-like chemotaxis protein